MHLSENDIGRYVTAPCHNWTCCDLVNALIVPVMPDILGLPVKLVGFIQLVERIV